MNDTIIWRLVWKEYRLMRGFWIGMAVLAIVTELIARLSIWSPNDSIQLVFAMAMVLPAFYAMGCGATLFATEHENGTFEFQRSLPVSPKQFFFGKLPFGLISTPPLFVLLWISAWLIVGMRLPDANFHIGLWTVCGVGALELFLWGVLFSLICRQPMRAAVLAAIAGSTTIHFIAMMGATQWRPEIYLEPRTIIYRLAVACVVAVVSVCLGYRWLGDGRTGVDDGRGRGRTSGGGRAAAIQRGKTAARSTILGRLAWQQWRQSRRMMLILAAMTLPLLLFMVGGWKMFFVEQSRDPVGTSVNFPMWIALTLATVPIAGASVFRADQRGRSFRFLTERGLNPRQVWLGRHSVWILAILLWTTLLVLPWVLFPVISWMIQVAAADHRDLYQPMEGVALKFALMGAGSLAYVICAYAAGQLSSMFFKSGLLAGFFALLLSMGLLLWSSLMATLAVPPLWSIAPIPIILLAATWLRAPHWMLERNGIKGWWATAGWLAVTSGLILAAVLTYRVREVPAISPGFSLAEFTAPADEEARATAEMYVRAGELIVPMARGYETDEEETKEDHLARRRAWIRVNREVIDMALEASRRSACDGFEPPGRHKLASAGDELAALLVAESSLLSSEGDPDAALDRCLAALRMSSHIRPRNRFVYPVDQIERRVFSRLTSWAAKPNQTPERVLTAVRVIEELNSESPTRVDAAKAEYQFARQIVEGDAALLGDNIRKFDDRTRVVRAVVAMQRMPWEKARTFRVLDWATNQQLTSLEKVEDAVAGGRSLPIPRHHVYYRGLGDRHLDRICRTTMVLDRIYDYDWFWDARRYVDVVRRRRATCIVLALAAWKLEHGELPESLDQLVGPFLTNLPPDPHAGEPFRYFREGIPVPITAIRSYADEPTELVAAGEPFIWSTGWQVCVSRSQEERLLDRYYFSDYSNSYIRPQSEYEIWRRGEYVTIP